MDGYRQGPRFGWLGPLVGLILLIVVAAIGYNVGVSAGAAASGAATGGAAVAPVYYGPWFFGGFHVFGFLFFLLILFLIFGALFRGRRWGGYGWHGGYGYGPGPWGWKSGQMRDVPPPFEPMLESWHKRAHGEAPAAPGPGDASETPPPGERQT